MTDVQPADEPRPHPFRSLFAAVVIFLVLVLATFGLKSYRDLAAVHGRERMLLAEIAGTEQRIAALRHRIASLKTDPVMLDRVAREELGLVRPEDVVIVLPAPPPPPVSPSPAPLPGSPLQPN